MEKSVDDLHSVGHVKRMLVDLKKLLEREKGLEKRIDKKILQLMIVWHDCWKAERNTENVFLLGWSNIYEGWGSAKIFRRQAKKVKLSKRKIKIIGDGIKKHTWFCRKIKRGREASVLWDLDNLEVWSLERAMPKKNHLFSRGWRRKDRFLVKAIFFYIQNFLMARSEKHLYFDWSKGEYIKRKEEFGEEMEKAWREYKDVLMEKKKRKWRFLRVFSRR